MKVTLTTLSEVLLVEPRVFTDERGVFFESYSRKMYESSGIPGEFVQDNHSLSNKNVLRGLHYQTGKGQAKLVRVTQGEVFDVAVDIRPQSPNFGRWVGVRLSGENRKQLYIPTGFAHGFCVLSETAEFLYKCSNYYSPADERGLAWDDPDIGIDWPVSAPILSIKDRRNPHLKDLL
jgi:dTDP-4-dehydrorhamnose 3,5-epimerase